MEEKEKLYADGFNNGYLLAKYEPVLAKKLTADNDNAHSEYFQGLVSGKKQLQMEKAKKLLKGLNSDNIPQTPTKGKTR